MAFAIFTFVKKAKKIGLWKYFNIFPNLSYKKRIFSFFCKKRIFSQSLSSIYRNFFTTKTLEWLIPHNNEIVVILKEIAQKRLHTEAAKSLDVWQCWWRYLLLFGLSDAVKTGEKKNDLCNESLKLGSRVFVDQPLASPGCANTYLMFWAYCSV